MLTGLTTPGARSSEFLVVVVLNTIAQIILAVTSTISDGTATKYGVAGAIAYAISRGLAKYEARPGPNPPSPPAA
jgi:hypothetical protein